MSETRTPTGVLREEHQLILQVLDILQRIVEDGEKGTWNVEAMQDCVAFFRLFADACHHGKEEDMLFPELVSRGMSKEEGPIAVMLFEHKQGRALVGQMNEALPLARDGQELGIAKFDSAARAYISLLRGHIFKEDNVLFNMADHMFDAPACAQLCKGYDSACAHRFEGRSKDELEELASNLQGRYGHQTN